MPSPGPDLDRVIARIRQWQKLTEQLPPAVEAQSALAEDAANSPVYDVGHAAWAGFAQAVDHLHAVQALITEAKMLHTYAPFSLIRGAMDNAALAVWLLAPESPDERLTRRLHLAYEDMRQSHDAYSLLGPSAPASRRPIEVRKQEVIDLAKSLRLDAGAVGGRWTGYEKIVRLAADETPGVEPGLACFIWRACSAFAHGRQWAALALLNRETHSRSPDVQNLRMTTSVEQVLLTAGFGAVALNHRALALYEERRQTPAGSAP